MPPLAIVGAVNGAKLIAAVKENWDGRSLDFETLASAMRMAALRTADRFDVDQAARDALTDADAAMADHLVSCLPTREELAAFARKPDLAATVASHVADKLAVHNPHFAEGAPSVAGFDARSFAAAVVQDVITAALANSDYRQSLMTYLQIETLQGVARIEAEQANQSAMLSEIVKSLGSAADIQTFRSIRDDVAKAVADNPDLAGADVVKQVKYLIQCRREELEKLKAIPAEDNRVRSLQAAAEQALANNNDEAAIAALMEAESAFGERQNADTRNRAKYTSIRAGLLLGQGDWHAADAAWAQAAAMLRPIDINSWVPYVLWAADKLYEFGYLFARTGAVEASESRLRALAAVARMNRDWRREADFLNRLGNSLKTRAERTNGEPFLILIRQAIDAYLEALNASMKLTDRTESAMINMSLGNALFEQGNRIIGANGDALMIEAIDAYHQALTICTKQTSPQNWAQIQINLGIALSGLGRRPTAASGNDYFKQSVSAYRNALTIMTELSNPIGWAYAQHNLGAALHNLGELTEGDTGLGFFREAVSAYQLALTVRTQNDRPHEWAKTQDNLGIVQRLLGERVEGAEGLKHLEASAAAHRAALIIYTSEHMPREHSLVATHLADAEAAIAARRG